MWKGAKGEDIYGRFKGGERLGQGHDYHPIPAYASILISTSTNPHQSNATHLGDDYGKPKLFIQQSRASSQQESTTRPPSKARKLRSRMKH